MLRGQRNNSIDFLKLLFTFIIAVHHFQEAIGICLIQHGDLAVEFFFMVSGFYLMDSFEKNHGEKSAVEYIKRRLRKLYPHYLFSLVILLLALGVTADSIQELFAKTVQTIPELFMMQDIGIFYYSGSNYPAWYLSVLILVSYFLYAGLKWNRNFCIQIGYPMLMLLGATMLFSEGNNNIVHWNAYGPFYLPVIRGTVDMILGIMIWNVVNKSIQINKVYGILLELASLFLIVVAMFGIDTQDSLALLGFPILLTLCFSRKNIFRSITDLEIFGRMGKYTYAMYLNHSLIIRIVKTMLNSRMDNKMLLVLIYLILLFGYSIVTEKIVDHFLSAKLERGKG